LVNLQCSAAFRGNVAIANDDFMAPRSVNQAAPQPRSSLDPSLPLHATIAIESYDGNSNAPQPP
jgi:hypothetical protein